MSERPSPHISNRLYRTRAVVLTALTAAAVAYAIAHDTPQRTRGKNESNGPQVTDALAAYVDCPPHSQASVLDVVKPQDGDPASIGFTCKNKQGDLLAPTQTADLSVTPYGASTPSAAEVGMSGAAKFVFRVVDLPAYASTGPLSKQDPALGATPFAFIELRGISSIEGPLPQASPSALAS